MTPDAPESPRLLIVARRALGREAVERLRAALDDVAVRRPPAIVFEDADVCRLVDGTWQPLKPGRPALLTPADVRDLREKFEAAHTGPGRGETRVEG